MKYFSLILVLCSVLLCQNGLGERLNSHKHLLELKSSILNNEVYNQENDVFENQLRNTADLNLEENHIDESIKLQQNGNAYSFEDEGIYPPQRVDCKCMNGKCVKEGGKEVCKCPPGYGNYTISFCKACECGPNKSCIWISSGWMSLEKTCFCNPGYFEDKGKCVECDCGSEGTCSYENGLKRCDCKPGTANRDGTCTECDCGSEGTCSYENGLKRCDCKPGTANRDGRCTECDCGSEGTCSYENGLKKCDCNLGTANNDGICTDCNCGEYSKSCLYNWKGDKICNCFPGYAEKYGSCEECNCGPYGSCSFQFGQKKCNCRPFAVEKNRICVIMESTTSEGTTAVKTTIFPSTTQYCNCGEYSKSCRYNWKGDKICDCFHGYAENYGSCEECNCGPYGSCSFQYGRKTCSCRPFAVEINGVCVVIGTSSERTTDSITTSTIASSTVQECDCGPRGRCTLESRQKKCMCDPFTSERNGRCIDCYCGENSKSCHFNWKGDKICNCTSGYSQIFGFCHDCNCGVNAQSCFYRKNGTKVCNCDFGFTQANGYCSAICSEDKCVHGKCKIMGNGFECRCNEGFTGERCEDKIQTKSNKLDLWKIMMLAIAFAIFILLSAVLCCLGRMRNKMSKK